MYYYIESNFPIESHEAEISSSIVLLTISRIRAIRRDKAQSGLGQTVWFRALSSHETPSFYMPESYLAYVTLFKESCLINP